MAHGLVRWLLLQALASCSSGAGNTLDDKLLSALPAQARGCSASSALAAARREATDAQSAIVGRAVLSERPSDSGWSFLGVDPLQQQPSKNNSTSSSGGDRRNKRTPGGMVRRIGACAVAAGSAGLLALASWLCCFRGGNVRRLCTRVLASRRAASSKNVALAPESPGVKVVQDASDDECTPLVTERVDDGTAAGVDSDPEEATWESSSGDGERSTLDKIDGTSERSLWSRTSSCSIDSHDKTTASEFDFVSTDGEAEADVEQMRVGAKSVSPTDAGMSTGGDITAELTGSDTLREKAFALAHQLVPHTTVTGHFYVHQGSPRDDTEASSANTRSYALQKARFESIAREWVAMQLDIYESLGDCSQHAELETTLVATYAELVASQEFVDEQSELVQRWERANAAVNEAAFRVVRSALDGYDRAVASLLGCTTLVRLNILEQRLDSLQVLDIFYPRDSHGLKSASASLVLGVNVGKLSLLELRALAHVFQVTTTFSIDAKEAVWLARLRKALVNVKHDYDAHRRAQMEDRAGTGWCCMSAQACAFRTSWECVLPVYKVQASANLMTAYCDLEASTH